MSKYASGKNAWGFSDRSGFRYRLSDMITEWNGSKVGVDEYEAKHPQLEPRTPGADPQALYDPRPDQRTETEVAVLCPDRRHEKYSLLREWIGRVGAREADDLF